MDFPELKQGQYAVLFAEVNTGIVLDVKFNRYIGHGQVWSIFDSLEDAESFARKVVLDNPSIECGIKNWSNEHVEIISQYSKK